MASWWFSTPMKNISQNGNLPQVGMKIKNVWNHHLDGDVFALYNILHLYESGTSIRSVKTLQGVAQNQPAAVKKWTDNKDALVTGIPKMEFHLFFQGSLNYPFGGFGGISLIIVQK